MKKLFLIAGLMLPLSAFAQLDDKTKVMKVRRNKDCFGIELSNINVMFLSIDNPFRVIYSGSGKLKVKLSDGIVTDLGDGKFLANVSYGTELAITVYEVNGKNETAIGTKLYRLKPVPKPIAIVAGLESGSVISKALLIASNGIGVVQKGFLFDVKYEIISYSALINVAGDFKSVLAYGATFNDQVMDLIYKLKSNARIIFEDIRIRISGSKRVITLPPITYKVRN